MIGRIAGIILHRGADQVLIDVGGIGYVVHVSTRTAAALPPAGQPCALYTELLVREDLLQLFGFPSLQEKEWHRLLTAVQGVGARAALAILGTLGPEGLGRAVALSDWAAVRAAPGIGPKLAQRVVLELQGKAPGVIALGGALTVDAAPAPAAGTLPAAGAGASEIAAAASAEALSALVNLGYPRGEAASAVAVVSADEGGDTATLIRAALRQLAPRG